MRVHAHGERRLKYPTKLVGGKWVRVSWYEAINEIGDGMIDDAVPVTIEPSEDFRSAHGVDRHRREPAVIGAGR